MTYTQIQNDVIQKYRIKLNPNSDCWSRTHAHPQKRMICKWKQANSLRSTFTLLHEVGHIVNNNSKMRRAEEEFYATVWALKEAHKYGLIVPYAIFELYQDYIDRERDRGIRRHGKGYGDYSLREALGSEYAEIVEE